MTNSSCTLTWTPPQDDGGSPVTGYYVELYNDWSWVQINRTPIKALSTTIPVESPQLQARVCAENAVSVGEYAESTITVYDVPGRPDAPQVERRTEHKAMLVITAPDNGGSPIIRYITEMKRKSATQWETVCGHDNDELKFMVKDLEPNCDYEFRATAVNAAGHGQPSPPALLSKFGKSRLSCTALICRRRIDVR